MFLCFAAAATLGVAMACVYGELASAFPETGGEYTILGRALGPRWGVAVLGLNLLGFSVAQALSGYGVASYLAAVWPWLPPRPTAAVLVVVVTLVSVLNIRMNARVTGLFLAVELLSLLVLTALGFAAARRGLGPALLHPWSRPHTAWRRRRGRRSAQRPRGPSTPSTATARRSSWARRCTRPRAASPR